MANTFDTEDLADGIKWVLEDDARSQTLANQARADAVVRFSYPVVAKAYQAVYEQVLSEGEKV